jgi:hypothetical protein
MSLMALSFTLMRRYVLSRPHLFEENVSIPAFRKGTILSLVFGPALYLTGVAASFIRTFHLPFISGYRSILSSLKTNDHKTGKLIIIPLSDTDFSDLTEVNMVNRNIPDY